MKLSDCWAAIESAALSNGVSALGSSELSDPSSGKFLNWIREHRHAEMSYLETNALVRSDPSERFPWARSVVVIAVPYSSERPVASPHAVSNLIARYALGDDYHAIIDEILVQMETAILRAAPDARTRRYVDTGPLSDRAYGAAAGIGWIGKNGMLIDPDRGSYFFIGTLLTSLENDVSFDEVTDRCGSCTRCIDACPTDAILPDRTLESDRCISYATIEQRGPLDSFMASKIEGTIFGCDICQEVCPWNDVAPPPSHPSFTPRDSYGATPVGDLLRLDQSAFSKLFSRSAVKRAKRAGILRNAILQPNALTEAIKVHLRSESDAGVEAALKLRASEDS
ncbi:MAG TPA: tRNA epoxyqueuosine(34) reductase QueG [Thermoanaerobaculia bacterium]|nr:tRNA epoxyqueuosine(34) reductase QueG [Thermoanaerobaculia bacterium]